MSGAVETQDQGRSTSGGLAGKYLSFFLAQEEYAIDILRVREIIGVIPMTPIPKAPAYVLGVINLRGKIIPVLDLRQRFGMGSVERDSQSCIVVVEIESDGEQPVLQVGGLVDTVHEVRDFSGADVEPAPRCANVQSEFILGLGKREDSVAILLDIEGIVRSIDLCNLTEQSGVAGA